MSRAPSLSRVLLRAAVASRWGAGVLSEALRPVLGGHARSFISSSARCQESSPFVTQGTELSVEPPRKYRPLADKELWHEAWMYEDKFGTEEDPIMVPSLENERIIGVTDPEDETLVVWGILKADEGPRQFIEGGEFYVLKVVEYIQKVGDVVNEIEASSKAQINK